MFTAEQIKAAHSKVKSGADFPGYVQEIKQLGLEKYKYKVADGSTVYYGAGGHAVSSPARYPALGVAANSSAEDLQYHLIIHQQGDTDFLTFCRQAAGAGVNYWEVNTETMLCSYYNNNGHTVLVEPIPQAAAG